MQVLATNSLLYNNQLKTVDEKKAIEKTESLDNVSKLERIKAQIKNGEYQVDIQKTAKAMVENYIF